MRLLKIVILAFFPIALAFSAAAKDQCDEFGTVLSTTPSPPSSARQIKDSMELIKSVPDAADVVLLGDSIMANWQYMFDTAFPGKKVFDFAVPGDRTQQVLWRMQQADAGLKKLAPTAVVVLIGTNNFTDRDATGCTIFQGVKAIVDKARETWPDTAIFVSAVAPRGPDFRDYDGVRKALNEFIMELGTNARVYPFKIDDMEITCGRYGDKELPRAENVCVTQEKYECENYTGDNLHFKSHAYEIFREALARTSNVAFSSDVFAN